jgi:hypothetical protein
MVCKKRSRIHIPLTLRSRGLNFLQPPLEIPALAIIGGQCQGRIPFIEDEIFFRKECRSRHPPFDLLMEAQMKYMLLIDGDERAWTESERQECYDKSTQLAQTLRSKGQYVATNPLQSVSTATSVQVRTGKRLVTDGPFAETREKLGGYFLVEAKDLDEAVDIAGPIPGARNGTVEIRPVVEIPNLPTE